LFASEFVRSEPVVFWRSAELAERAACWDARRRGVRGVAPTSLDSDYRLRRRLSATRWLVQGDLVSCV